MDSRILVTAVMVVTTMMGFAGRPTAQSAGPTKVEGLFHDYTADLDSSGPWQLLTSGSSTAR